MDGMEYLSCGDQPLVTSADRHTGTPVVETRQQQPCEDSRPVCPMDNLVDELGGLKITSPCANPPSAAVTPSNSPVNSALAISADVHSVDYVTVDDNPRCMLTAA